MTPKLPLVLIGWLDTLVDNSWIDYKDIEPPKPLQCITVGYLVGENDLGVLIASTVAIDGSINGSTTIPKGMINLRKVIKT